jgi:hypothetical protein
MSDLQGRKCPKGGTYDDQDHTQETVPREGPTLSEAERGRTIGLLAVLCGVCGGVAFQVLRLMSELRGLLNGLLDCFRLKRCDPLRDASFSDQRACEQTCHLRLQARMWFGKAEDLKGLWKGSIQKYPALRSTFGCGPPQPATTRG